MNCSETFKEITNKPIEYQRTVMKVLFDRTNEYPIHAYVVCPGCGNTFQKKTNKQHFCSLPCKNKYHNVITPYRGEKRHG